MGQRGFEQYGQTCGIFVQKGFQCGHAGVDLLRRRRDESRIPWPGSANPILTAAKLSGLLVAATAFGHEGGVHFAEQAIGEWEALPKPRHAVFQGCNVVGNLNDIIHGTDGDLFQLEKQKIGERRLGSFDLRGKNSFAPDIRIEKQVRIRQKRADAIQSPNG